MDKSLVVKLNKSMHKEFKKIATDNDETMSSVIIDCIRTYISEKKKIVIH